MNLFESFHSNYVQAYYCFSFIQVYPSEMTNPFIIAVSYWVYYLFYLQNNCFEYQRNPLQVLYLDLKQESFLLSATSHLIIDQLQDFYFCLLPIVMDFDFRSHCITFQSFCAFGFIIFIFFFPFRRQNLVSSVILGYYRSILKLYKFEFLIIF